MYWFYIFFSKSANLLAQNEETITDHLHELLFLNECYQI